MERIGYLLAGITLVWLWVDQIRIMLFFKKNPSGLQYRNGLTMWLDRKPINCGLCLSLYTGILLSILLNDILFISLPLIYTLIHKKL